MDYPMEIIRIVFDMHPLNYVDQLNRYYNNGTYNCCFITISKFVYIASMTRENQLVKFEMLHLFRTYVFIYCIRNKSLVGIGYVFIMRCYIEVVCTF